MIGGARTFWGALVGAAVIAFLPWILTLTEIESRLMLYGALYIVIMIFRPEGLLGQPRRRVEGHAASAIPSSAHEKGSRSPG